jgi:hypothetical protein
MPGKKVLSGGRYAPEELVGREQDEATVVAAEPE